MTVACSGTADRTIAQGWPTQAGVFRSVGVGARSMMISAAVAIPLAASGWGYFSQNAGQIGFSAVERLGGSPARARWHPTRRRNSASRRAARTCRHCATCCLRWPTDRTSRWTRTSTPWMDTTMTKTPQLLESLRQLTADRRAVSPPVAEVLPGQATHAAII
jgi:hypothetical protein